MSSSSPRWSSSGAPTWPASTGPGRGSSRPTRERLGWPDAAPYDRVLVSAEPRTLPDELVEQLTDDGRMVIPVSGTMLLVQHTAVGHRGQRARLVPVRAAALNRLWRVSDPEFGEELVRLASADNFRDVTGPDSAYVAADGRPLRRGVAYRSNELQLSHADAATIARLGVTAIYDLRSDARDRGAPRRRGARRGVAPLEVERHPDGRSSRSSRPREAADA